MWSAHVNGTDTIRTSSVSGCSYRSLTGSRFDRQVCTDSTECFDDLAAGKVSKDHSFEPRRGRLAFVDFVGIDPNLPKERLLVFDRLTATFV